MLYTKWLYPDSGQARLSDSILSLMFNSACRFQLAAAALALWIFHYVDSLGRRSYNIAVGNNPQLLAKCYNNDWLIPLENTHTDVCRIGLQTTRDLAAVENDAFRIIRKCFQFVHYRAEERLCVVLYSTKSIRSLNYENIELCAILYSCKITCCQPVKRKMSQETVAVHGCSPFCKE